MICVKIGYPRGILIDPSTGKRFINELSGRKERSDAIIKLDHPALLICDALAATHALFGLSRALQSKVVEKFDTLEELAKNYQIDFEVLWATVQKYNLAVDLLNLADSSEKKEESGQSHESEFGRPITFQTMPITQPPYYAMRVLPKVHYCCGGLMTDASGRVLEESTLSPIQNLYACGEVTGGMHGVDRLGGCSLAECLVFGRRVGSSLIQSKNAPHKPCSTAI